MAHDRNTSRNETVGDDRRAGPGEPIVLPGHHNLDALFQIKADAHAIGIAPEAQVMTPDGTRPAGDLRPGDRVVTYRGGAQELVANEAAGVPARIASVRSGAFGADEHFRIAADQPVLLKHFLVKALYDIHEILVRPLDIDEPGLVDIEECAEFPLRRLVLRTPDLLQVHGVWLSAAAAAQNPLSHPLATAEVTRGLSQPSVIYRRQGGPQRPTV